MNDLIAAECLAQLKELNKTLDIIATSLRLMSKGDLH